MSATMRVVRGLLAAGYLAAAGCSAGGGGPGDAGELAAVDGGDDDPGAPEGGEADLAAADAGDVGADAEVVAPDKIVFEIELVESASAGDGAAMAWATAGNTWHFGGPPEEKLRVGACAYRVPRLPGFCDPPCPAGKICRWDNACHEPFKWLSAGEINVTGLKVGLKLTVHPQYHYYEAAFSSEPTDGDIFDAGAVLAATAGGGPDFPAFTVKGLGTPALETDFPCVPELVKDQHLVVHWAPADPAAKVFFGLLSGNHGEQFSSLACETDDSGELVVDAALVTAYLLDWHPLHRWSLTRQTAGSTAIPQGLVVLHAASTVGCNFDAFDD